MTGPLAEISRFIKEGRITGVRITFSRNCYRGIVSAGEQCECWRCRKSRGQPLDSEIEQIAARRSEAKRLEFREIIRGETVIVHPPRRHDG